MIKKIANWTLGSVFRTIGRIIAYICIGLLLVYFGRSKHIKITDLLGIYRVHAATNVAVSDKSFYVRWENYDTGQKDWSSRSSMGTAISYPGSDYLINALSARFISNSAYFTKGIKYRVVVDVRYGNGTNANTLYKVGSLLCSGSTSTSWTTNEDLIDSCSYISKEYLSESNKMRYYFDIITNTDVRGIKVNFYFTNANYWNIGNVNILTSSYVSYDTSTQQAIESSTTTIINNNNENTQNIIDSVHGLADGIHDNDTSEATSEASDFFSNFSTNTHGLTSIITAPLNTITSLTSSTCTPLHIPIPYLTNKYLDLPCMRAVYVENFGSFMTLYDVITLGIVSYWILVRIFALVKDIKNPEHDEIEVVDL